MPAAARRQLRFPFTLDASSGLVSVQEVGRPESPSSRTRLTLGTRSVLATLARSPESTYVRLEAMDDGPGASSIALDLRLRPMLVATIRSDSRDRLHWGLSALAPGTDPHEFFSYALRWTARKLAGETGDRRRLRAVEAGVRPLLRAAAASMAAALAPAVRAAAGPFAPRTRARIATALARDPAGWLAQAARAHPGLVLFGLALADVEETEDAGITLLHDLGQGRRLGPALDAAVGAWAAALPAWAAPGDLRPRPVRGAFAAAAALRGDARVRMLSAQKVLVRRAGPWCEPEALLVPPPLRFAPEDLPAAPRPNAAWFRVMKVPGVTVEGRPAPVEPALAEAFSAFASRHATALARVPRGVGLATWLAELVTVLRLSGRTPSRATDPARLVAQVDVRGLKRRLDEPQPGLFVRPRPAAPAAVAPPVAVAVAAEPVAPEPAPVDAGAEAPRIPGRYDTRSKTISPRAFEPWTSEHASVAQITTLLELREEGARMRNCVADYRNMVERGDLVVFSARVEGRPITIAIRPYMSGWRLSEWKGFANRSLTPSEVAALRPWMQARGIGDWWGPR